MTRSEHNVLCPDCRQPVRPCNLNRHRRTHLPRPVRRTTAGYQWTKFTRPKRPLIQYRDHDRRYDEAFPRGEGRYRFRVYRLRAGELQLLAAAPDPPGYGVALFELYEDGEYIVDDATGILDTIEDPGDWIVHPFALGRRREAA
jgi:hypothetical protein